MVWSRAFWLQSGNSMAGSRSLRHQVVVTWPGARRSTSRAKACAARRTPAVLYLDEVSMSPILSAKVAGELAVPASRGLQPPLGAF